MWNFFRRRLFCNAELSVLHHNFFILSRSKRNAIFLRLGNHMRILLLIIIIVLLNFHLAKAFASISCLPTYDNGQYCTTVDDLPTPTIPAFPIINKTLIRQTPATGPESLALFALIPTGILGWFLRKKSK